MFNIKKIIILMALPLLPFFVYGDNSEAIQEPNYLEKSFIEQNTPKAQYRESTPSGITPPVIQDQTLFILKGVEFSGNKKLDNTQIAGDLTNLLNQKITFQQLQNAVNSITEIYRQRGYITSYAYLPPQRIQDGIVKINIIEGSVGEVRITGNVNVVNARISKILEKLKDDDILDYYRLERTIMLLNSLPGLTAKFSLKAAKQQVGKSDVVIDFAIKKLDTTIVANNNNQIFDNPWNFAVANKINNLSNNNDSLGIFLVGQANISDLKMAEVSYDFPIGINGLRGFIGVSGSKMSLNDLSSSSSVASQHQAIKCSLLYPMILKREENLIYRLNFNHLDNKASTSIFSFYHDKIREVELEANYNYADKYRGINYLGVKVKKGMSILHATKYSYNNKSKVAGDANFIIGEATVSRQQFINDKFSIKATIFTQHANKALLSASRYSVGSATSNKAYPLSKLTGDNAIEAALRLNYAPNTKFFYKSLNLYTEFAYGQLRNKKPSLDEKKKIITNGSVIGASIGDKAMQLYLEYAIPFKRKINNNKYSKTVYAGLRYSF